MLTHIFSSTDLLEKPHPSMGHHERLEVSSTFDALML